MSDEYMTWSNDERHGPYTIQEIAAMWERKEIRDTTLISKNGSQFSYLTDWWADVAAGLCANHPPEVPNNPPEKVEASTPKKLSVGKAIGCGFLFLIAIFFGVPALDSLFNGSEHRSAYHDDSMAYTMAQLFVQRNFPEAKVYSDQSQSMIKRSGGKIEVAFIVDGKNAFGGPVRKAVIVEMVRVGEDWTCERIIQ